MIRKNISLITILFWAIACEITPEEITVDSVSLSQSSAEMIVGETTLLKATILPSNATNKEVTWASSKQSVASISDNGLVTAIAEGSSTITASAGGKSATCTIQVSKKVIEVMSIELDKKDVELVEGESKTLVATVKPDDATDKTISWSSLDVAVASVDGNGKVTAIKEGNTTIVAKTGDKQVTCAVTVSKKVIVVESVTLNKNSLSLEKGQSETLTANVNPDDATDKSVKWSSSDEQVATVNQDGKVTAIRGGAATITAMAGEKSASCEVIVTVSVTGVSLNQAVLNLAKGATYTLSANVTPQDATNKSVSWSSSNTAVSTVNNEGVVTAITNGTAIITVKTADKGFTVTCNVTVSIPVTGVSVTPTSLSMKGGESKQLVAVVTPSNASNKEIEWRSSNASIAYVNQDGLISASNGGSATITARTKDGGYEAFCHVTVTVPVTGVSLNQASLSLMQYDTWQLTATVNPSNATNKTVVWSSDNTSIATVSSDGLVTAVGGGSTRIRARTEESGYEGICTVSVTADAHQAVDLGLSVKWAACNYGSTSPSGKGGYYLWGDYSGNGTAGLYDAPNVNAISGTSYDIVRRNWGGNWRIPTRAEMQELINKCSLMATTQGGVSGVRVTGPNGNSIFLPYAGYCMPADGPIGSTKVYDTSTGYYMTGTSYGDSYGRFFYVYKYNPSAASISYNASFVKVSIRPVR